ncbi:hypothetical protein PsorP6_003122 [Peronosclerospora sorghi]|uniref:Uncharacterized protein n=1 Tax=Peronosclerospora sorghi TaxID=230839 RepID=A0ACC0VR77_9STRA|nr:hypothetical protein PsorP6_003122 [Peronosclerospora sorghi]
MKFGKRMRALASPEWATDYVDYKALKREIKVVFGPGRGSIESVETRIQRFHALFESEMQRLNQAHGRILDDLVERELRPLQATLGTRWVLPPATARTLLLDVLHVSHRVDALRRFVVLNSLALVKLAKKVEKTVHALAQSNAPSRLKTHVLDTLTTQAFYDATSLDAVCDTIACVTDRVMLCVLPDGTFRLGPRALTCPICLSSHVHAPITLACGHTFCWSCLSRATEHRFRSCPLCRRVQSLDPRDYDIDGLVKRFQRVYDSIEQDLATTPLVTSPMRQMLAEAFDVCSSYVRAIEEKHAALTPPPLPCTSVKGQGRPPVPKTQEQEEEGPTDPVVATFATGDIVEILQDEHWYAGLVLERHDEPDETYAVLWWVQDKSQRCSQLTPRHLLREPHVDQNVPPAVYGYALDAWRRAASWAREPLGWL